LSKEGFRVLTAADGPEGLRLARTHRPDAITLDVIMPEMDGWAVLSTLTGDPQLADIPVIMLTIVDDKEKGYALGASDYLTKPIDRARLRTVLNQHRRDPPGPVGGDQGTARRPLQKSPGQRGGRGGVHGSRGAYRTGGAFTSRRAAARRDPARLDDARDGRLRVSPGATRARGVAGNPRDRHYRQGSGSA